MPNRGLHPIENYHFSPLLTSVFICTIAINSVASVCQSTFARRTCAV